MKEKKLQLRLIKLLREQYYGHGFYTNRECAFVTPDSNYQDGMKLIYYPNNKKQKISARSLYIALTSTEERNFSFYALKEIEVIIHIFDFNQLTIIQYDKNKAKIDRNTFIKEQIESCKNNRIPFLVYDEDILISIPMSSNDTTNYTEYHITDKIDIEIISEYISNIDVYDFLFPTFDQITENITASINYVENFDFNHVANSYKVIEDGYFLYHPGKDDSFNINRKKSIETDDEFVRSLFPLEEERTYYSCCGRGIGDNDYDGEIRHDMINECIKKAQEQYSKSKHYSYFISKYFKKLYEAKSKLELFQKKISELFNYSNVLNDVWRMYWGGAINDRWVVCYNQNKSHYDYDDEEDYEDYEDDEDYIGEINYDDNDDGLGNI